MKILAVFPTFRPEDFAGKVGGGEISNRILLQSLSNRGHSITVCTITGGNHSESKVVVRSAEGKSWGKFFNKIIGLVRFKILVTHETKRLKPDIILCGTKGVGIAVQAGRKLGVPVGVFIRAFENLQIGVRRKSFARKVKMIPEWLVYGDYGPKTVGKVNFFIPNSLFIQKMCLETFPHIKSKVVYPPITEVGVKPLKVNNSIKSVFMVGTSTSKGAHVFKYLSSKFPDINFGIIGDPTVPPGEVRISGNIKRYGWTDVVRLLSDEADLFLVPSMWEEPFGRVAIEGLIAGSPLLVSNIGGLPETVNFESSLMVSPADVSEWESRVAAVIEKPDSLNIALSRAQSRVYKYFHENQVHELEIFLLSSV